MLCSQMLNNQVGAAVASARDAHEDNEGLDYLIERFKLRKGQIEPLTQEEMLDPKKVKYKNMELELDIKKLKRYNKKLIQVIEFFEEKLRRNKEDINQLNIETLINSGLYEKPILDNENKIELLKSLLEEKELLSQLKNKLLELDKKFNKLHEKINQQNHTINNFKKRKEDLEKLLRQ
jgi:hypothetical protein